jgi:hypothetical protein
MNGMKSPTLKSFISIGVCIVICLIAVACHKTGRYKKLTPEATRQMRLGWNQKNLVEAYKAAGGTDPKWDEQAENALNEWARIRSHSADSNEDWRSIISDNCASAKDAGCTDPMIRYLSLRSATNQTGTQQEVANEYCKVALDLEGSPYPSIRKFYAWDLAGEQLKSAYGSRSNFPPELQQLNTWGLAESDLLNALSDRTMPPEETYDACHELLEVWKWNNDHYSSLYQNIEGRLTDDWKSDPLSLLLKGEVYIQLGWQARGYGYADTITSDGGKLFGKRLAMAEEALNTAWELNTNEPRIAVKMMSVELGQGKGRDRMELWFRRAMKADPNDYDACDAKLLYLEPKWYGSVADMLAFGHECVQNERWGGHVPLILMDAHVAIQQQFSDAAEKADYWKRSEVWTDLNSAFERFFELNPEEIGWYHNYAWYAYQAGQWATLNQLIPKLGPVNYNYFGGRNKFEEMVAQAKAHAGKPK